MYIRVWTKLIEESNAAFVIAEKVRYDELFSNIDGKSLDDQQRTAIVKLVKEDKKWPGTGLF